MANAARRDQEQRTVEVNRERLVKILKQNRETHIQQYQEAVEGYKAMALQKLAEGHEKAKSRLQKNYEKGMAAIKEFDPEDPKATSDYLTLAEADRVELKVPRNYSKEYDAAIDMAEWDVRETLELTHAEFTCFVRDQWDWKSDFQFVNSMYSVVGG